MITVQYQQLGEPHGFGTMHLIEYFSGKNVVCRGVVDCGINFKQVDGHNNSFPPAGNFLIGSRVDFIAVTHAHMDHAGAIPRLAREHPEANIFISEHALKGAEALLRDSVKIMSNEYRRQKDSGQIPTDLFCGQEDLEMFFNNERLVVVYDENVWCESEDTEWKIGFYPSGHDQGARMVAIRYPDAPSILITGDIYQDDQEIVQGVMLPDEDFLNEYDFIKQSLILITEGTNGAKSVSTPRAQLRSQLVSLIHEVQAREGVPLIPTFSRGRGSEMIQILCRAGFKVHVDGGIRKMAELEIPGLPQLMAQNQVRFFEAEWRAAQEHRRLLAIGQDPCGLNYSPIISPSARLEGGPSISHAINLLPERKNAMISVGYLFPDSLAMKVFKIRRGRTVSFEQNGQKVPVNVRCDVHHISFSAHDDQGGLVERAHQLKPAHVIVHHCNAEAYEALKPELQRRLGKTSQIHRAEHMKKIKVCA